MGKRNMKGAKGPAPHLRSRTTRSSRGRLVTSTDANPNEQLSTQLSLLGLYAAPTIGDGNCLFRALADQVYGSAVLHAEVRKQVCDWIEAHGERYEGFVEDEGEESEGGRGKRRGNRGKGDGKEGGKEKEGGPSKRLQAYLRGMRENATYGGHMELSAFAHMMRRNIKVIQPGLVYVIEWRAGGSSSSSSSSTAPSTSTSASSAPSNTQSQPDPTPSTPPRRRSTRTPSVGGITPPKKPKHEDKDVQKVRTGRHGYYVLEEVTSDEEEDEDEKDEDEEEQGEDAKEEKEVAALVVGEEEEVDGGPTLYVAYHDWEHFSSIRNLRGPHTGLPNIMETLPQTQDLPSPAEVEKEALKEREREKKRERERKDKERKEERKERSALKVKLKVPSATPEPSVVAAAVPHPAVQDPSLIPLPTSRSASPFPSVQSLTTPEPAQPLSTPARHPLSMSTSSSSSIEAAAAPAHLRSHSRQPHLQGAATPGARAQYRSPKRTFDESSASGGDDAEGREGREKRSRMRGASMVGDESPAVPAVGDDMVVDVDGEADTPGLSAPGSTSSSETSSEVASEMSSLSTSPSPAPEVVAPVTTPKKTARFQHPVHGEKTLTRRQRKALGLPKQRAVAPPPGVSAGKIVIPGGRWTGRPLPPAAAGGTESEADEEWRRNGNGRLDVRGFRELKI